MSREPATLIVLAGGEARRMGFPKHRLAVDGKDVLTILHMKLGRLFVETVVIGRDLGGLPPGVRSAEDRYDVRSPLVGIHAGLSASRTDLAFVVACDMPYVEPALVEFLLSQAEGTGVVVPVVRGYVEPLCAAYRRTCLEAIERLIERGTLKVSELYPLVGVRRVGETEALQYDPQLQSFVNLNVPTVIETAGEAGRPCG